MKKIKPMKFTKTDYQAMQVDAKHWGAINFTIEQIKDVLKRAPDCAQAIWEDFERVGHPSGKYGMDTAVRDIWFSAIGQAFVGRDWPINGDGAEVGDKFFKDLVAALKKNKIKFGK